MTRVLHAWPYCRVKEQPQEKETSQNESRLQFSWRQCQQQKQLRVTNQFRGKRQPQHLKRLFSVKNKSIHFHIGSTSVIILVKRNQLSFSRFEINKLLPAPFQCLVGQIQVQKPILVVTTDQMTDHTQSREQNHHHRKHNVNEGKVLPMLIKALPFTCRH